MGRIGLLIKIRKTTYDFMHILAFALGFVRVNIDYRTKSNLNPPPESYLFL